MLLMSSRRKRTRLLQVLQPSSPLTFLLPRIRKRGFFFGFVLPIGALNGDGKQGHAKIRHRAIPDLRKKKLLQKKLQLAVARTVEE